MTVEEFIKELNKIAHNHFETSDLFFFEIVDGFNLCSTGNNPSFALNRRKNSAEEVKVVKFVNEIWVYSIINLRSIKPLEIQSVSFSFFKGTDDDRVKQHLFRAEWDSYESTPHPQAHWHFYSNEEIEYLKKQFEEIIDAESSGFMAELTEEAEKKAVPFQKMHFAMNNQWHSHNGHVYLFKTPEEFINWFDGLLNHLKLEFDYAMK